MKTNVFRVFLLSFFVVGQIFTENIISEKDVCDIIQKPEFVDELATKGALIEAVFILQNKKNSLARHLRRVKIALLEVDHLIKDLVYERQILFDHFYRHKVQSAPANKIDRILIDLSVFYNEMLNINLIKGIYPNYLKQIQQFVNDIDSTIAQFMSGNPLITFSDLQIKVAKFDNILDIIDQEQQLFDLVLESENIKLNRKKHKDRINSRYSQLALYQDSIQNKENSLFIEYKDLVDSSIKRLKKAMAKCVRDIECKQGKIEYIKQNLTKYYNDHQAYARPAFCGSKSPLGIGIENAKLMDVKVEPSLNWFINSVEDIRRQLNKNFNIEDLG